MRDVKIISQSLEPSVEPRDVSKFVEQTGSIYKSLAIIAKRANQVSKQLKDELHAKLEEFNQMAEPMEEVLENKEQIEVSRFYEKLPNPATIATAEFLQHKLYFRDKTEETPEED